MELQVRDYSGDLWFQALKLDNLSVSPRSEPQTSKDTYRNPFSVFSSAQVGPLDSSSSSFSSTDLLRQTRKAISNFLIDLIANFRLQPLERKHRQLGGDPPARHSAVQHGRMKAACGTAAPQQHAQQVFAFSQQLISEPANSEQRPASSKHNEQQHSASSCSAVCSCNERQADAAQHMKQMARPGFDSSASSFHGSRGRQLSRIQCKNQGSSSGPQHRAKARYLCFETRD